MKKLLAFLLPVLALTACNAQPPVVTPLRIGLSPAAHPISEAVFACVPNPDSLIVSIETRYPNIVDLKDFDIYIQLGEPEALPAFVAQIAWENVVVVTHPSSELELDAGSAADLFGGRSQGDMALWVGPAGDEARQAFEESVAHGSPVVGSAHLAASPADLLAAIAADPQAAGILPLAWADDSVRTLNLNIQMPVLILAIEEPSGPERDLVACLQSEVGQAAISDRYTPFTP